MPLLWLCLAFLSGIVLSAFLPISHWIWLGLVIFFSAASWLEWKFSHSDSHPLLSKPLFRIPFSLLIAALALGGWRFQIALPQISPQDLASYASKETVRVSGRVISFPEESSSSTVAILQAQSISLDDEEKPVSGKLELRLPGGFNLSYGDVLSLEGPLASVLQQNNPPYQSYLARRGIYSRMQYPEITTIKEDTGNPVLAGIYRLREQAQQTIYNQIPFPESALLAGILLGTDWNIPDYLEDAYQACGVLHIIAISGFNIALISSLIIRLTKRIFSPAKAGVAAILTIIVYTLMVGAEPAVVRAAVMGSLTIPAYYIGRKVIALHSLVIAGALMLIGNPFLLWDISFQLSFLACLGLITMVDPNQNWVRNLIEKRYSEAVSQWWMPIFAMIISTLAAQFAVSPVLIHMNPQISIFSLPANLALLPVQPVLMGLGGLAVIIGLVVPSIGQLFAYAAWPFLAYCNRVALHFGMQPNSEVSAPPVLFWFSLAAVISTLIFFTIQQIRELSSPSIKSTSNH
jgi:competence protein ComEC